MKHVNQMIGHPSFDSLNIMLVGNRKKHKGNRTSTLQVYSLHVFNTPTSAQSLGLVSFIATLTSTPMRM